ncbi:GntR family transcriptional regulator [Brachybacterium sp. Marseille-Q7125]|uniref:GntR family transcriptional regulator n=1 Tax=Brachybacterium sp. Marseille-Q7125 TaxID=2932815 RepID=UPI00248D199B|nr:GntR family transcriptional regulator [Brachybacterium sp. Marseille-Q7125]
MPAIDLIRDGGPALWRQVEQDLRRRIDLGEYPTAFPGEKVLAAEYGVSRQTMRQALRPLRESGLVSAERGRTPRVCPGVVEQPVGVLYSLFASVEDAGHSQDSRVLRLEETTDPEAAAHLNLPADHPLLVLTRLRCSDGVPLALDTVYLDAELARPLLDADFSHTALYTQMEQRLGVVPRFGHEVIEAVTLAAENAELLGVTPRSPGFRIERFGRSERGAIEWRITLLRGDQFRLTSHFTPTTGQSWDLTRPDAQPDAQPNDSPTRRTNDHPATD